MAAARFAEQLSLSPEKRAQDSSHIDVRAVRALTLRQVQVLRCVEGFCAVHGYPPTIRDLASMLEMSSNHAVVEHLEALARKGFIRRDGGEARGIQLLVGSEDAPLLEARPLAKSRRREVLVPAKKASGDR